MVLGGLILGGLSFLGDYHFWGTIIFGGLSFLGDYHLGGHRSDERGTTAIINATSHKICVGAEG